MNLTPNIIKTVAEHLLGEPNASLTKDDDIRYGANGSLSIKPSENQFYDHEANCGGGVFDLIVHRGAAADRNQAAIWLKQQGIGTAEKTSANQVRQVRDVRRQQVAEYNYRSSSGALLFQVIRTEPKGFFQRKPMTGGGWSNSVRGVEQVPYRLPELLAKPDATVFITEGEKDADRLLSIGLVATCNAGGAGKWRSVHSDALVGRDVVVLPDNDDAGHAHAVAVANSLMAKAKSVLIVKLPDLPAKGDVSDWLDAGGSAEKLQELVIQAAATAETADADDEEEKVERESQVDKLVRFAKEHFHLLHDKNNDAFAQHKQTGIVSRLNGRQFRDSLIAGFYAATEQVVRDRALREALVTLGALARFEGAAEDVHVRVARHQANYYIDLCEPDNSRAVELTAGSWRIVDAPPVKFLRGESMQPLPEPLRGGSIEALWAIANIPEAMRQFVVAWLIDAMRPETPYPGIELVGEQGSGKSTAAEAIRRAIDPNSCNLRGAPRTVEDIFVAAGQSHVLAYENISHLTPGMQDAMCVLSTGGGYAKRALYTNDEEHIINVRRPWLVNGIAVCVTQQDLVDRIVSIECPVIQAREASSRQWSQFEKALPSILGGVLDLAAKALLELPNVRIKPADRPRLVEFATLAMAVGKVEGRNPDDVLAAFKELRAETVARTIDSSPVATAIVDLVEVKIAIKASVKKILQMLENHRPTGADAWPKTAKGLGDALRRAAPALRAIGIECRSLGKNGAGLIEWSIAKKLSEPSPASPPSPGSATTPDMPDISDIDSTTFSSVVEEEL